MVMDQWSHRIYLRYYLLILKLLMIHLFSSSFFKSHPHLLISNRVFTPQLLLKWNAFYCKLRFELGLEKPNPKRAFQSALTIAVSYILGGLIPLFPYMVMKDVDIALLTSVAFTLVALLVFGFVKGYFTGMQPIISSLQTAFIGAIASAAAFGIALLIR